MVQIRIPHLSGDSKGEDKPKEIIIAEFEKVSTILTLVSLVSPGLRGGINKDLTRVCCH